MSPALGGKQGVGVGGGGATGGGAYAEGGACAEGGGGPLVSGPLRRSLS